ncbi:hypothetical protein [Xenorhabdus szentirmaii]|uniref:hypothetical protein n=1 Tax=Xenorhabdus szentirmaii TaxID=290112 RepID=UPI001988DDDF|nr:hypothetical protein [Xenorhabdus sp. 38]MBD2782727.1 hypothetical protein [Xenorhabdus sp. 38]
MASPKLGASWPQVGGVKSGLRPYLARVYSLQVGQAPKSLFRHDKTENHTVLPSFCFNAQHKEPSDEKRPRFYHPDLTPATGQLAGHPDRPG